MMINEVLQWIKYAEGFPTDPQACIGAQKELNEALLDRSVLLGNGFTPSEADACVIVAVHASVIGFSDLDKKKFQNVFRWVTYIQKLIDLLKPKSAAKEEVDSIAEKTVQSTKSADKPEAGLSTKKSDAGEIRKLLKRRRKTPEVDAVEKDKELSVSLLNRQVGLIRKAWKHPSADSLLVEEIDVGEAKLRQVVSGLAKFCNPEELTNRRVVELLITNVKPWKLRDMMSEGLVLCASSADHTIVEPILPQEGSKIGERVLFSG
ncbi:LOW QUALITY PROTEIN: tRNA-aminoacylation cofactor arc1-like [Argentina anserina]|uniref:LOW QUALITY PROTEIN: tRNA-aminoacylation cofactor arc1-like n=1 Tax=Argentina anserina TaxID=57926 RepID=UPI00217695B8|nr:LOW QUALITY PROTEIN: tRNA-aminoacylation cofactor arc1-like [Potentilla anserina]